MIGQADTFAPFRSRAFVAVTLAAALGAVGQASGLPALGIFQAPTTPASTAPVSDVALVPEPDQVGEAELAVDSESSAPTAAAGPSRAKQLFGGRDAEPELAPLAAPAPPVALVDPTGHALDAFFRSLDRTRKKEPGAVTRIAHFGDSMIVSDYVSATLRQKLQESFGDAGHGFMLTANAWPAYYHDGVSRFSSKGYRVSRIVGPLTDDGFYGLGGVTFRAGPGVISEFGTAPSNLGELPKEERPGNRVSRFTVSFLRSPGAGSFVVSVDGEERAVVDTAGPETRVDRFVLDVPDGAHRFRLSYRGAETRTFGVVFERDEPGVVLDALGVQGARIRFLDQQDDAHFMGELAWRAPALVVFQFGANESGDGYAYPMDQYQLTMGQVLEQTKRALPHSSCLVVGAMDRARVENGAVTSMKIIQLIVKEQRIAAERFGCAYFDTYESMGGWGSMPNWVKRGLGQADMTHPSAVGADRLGTWLYRALMQDYERYRERGGSGTASRAE